MDGLFYGIGVVSLLGTASYLVQEALYRAYWRGRDQASAIAREELRLLRKELADARQLQSYRTSSQSRWAA